ncbi:heterokaryon incompatibility protein-domain-containing protein [Scleroderma yunnanense]
MYMINVKAFIKREQAMEMGKEDCRINVLEFRDDEATDYAILSHRWTSTEVGYKEMIKLAKMKEHGQKAVRTRDGYRKILASCEQAKRDGYEWLWVDTCCIDKRSSAELSEAINSMYRWYANSKVCYAYLHDIISTSFPTEVNNKKYPNSNGWPEWFSRGWTLQEMIAPSNVQFFNKHWQLIGDKQMHACTLEQITSVPGYILTRGLSSDRPCVAQIMSWAANRKTTRVEDRAYSLLGLLDVNMPMLYGEGKKAFQRLQLEIIRTSNDQSIFAWGFESAKKELILNHGKETEDSRRGRRIGRSGSILADDPSFFRDCGYMRLKDRNYFIQTIKALNLIREEELRSIDEDQLDVFPITNRGIQMGVFLSPYAGSDSTFQAWLPCEYLGSPVRILLVLRNSNYYRYYEMKNRQGDYPTSGTLQFRQVYLKYQDTHPDVAFEIDDSAIIENGFTHCSTYPSEPPGNPFTLTNTDPSCIKVYTHDRDGCRLGVGVGQYFGQHWIHVVCEEPADGYSLEKYAEEEYYNMLVNASEHAQSMAEVYSRFFLPGEHQCWIKYTCLPGLTWTVRTSCVEWESSYGVRIEILRYPYNGPDRWTSIKVEGGRFFLVQMR